MYLLADKRRATEGQITREVAGEGYWMKTGNTEEHQVEGQFLGRTYFTFLNVNHQATEWKMVEYSTAQDDNNYVIICLMFSGKTTPLFRPNSNMETSTSQMVVDSNESATAGTIPTIGRLGSPSRWSLAQQPEMGGPIGFIIDDSPWNLEGEPGLQLAEMPEPLIVNLDEILAAEDERLDEGLVVELDKIVWATDDFGNATEGKLLDGSSCIAWMLELVELFRSLLWRCGGDSNP